MKALKFRHNLVKKILDGSKTVTWRLFDDKNLQGDKLNFIDWQTGEKFAEAEIVGIKEKKFGDLEDADFEGHEKFGSRDELLRQYREYYGNKVGWDTLVKILTFKILKKFPPKA